MANGQDGKNKQYSYLHFHIYVFERGLERFLLLSVIVLIIFTMNN